MKLRSRVRRFIQNVTGFDVHVYRPERDFYADASRILGNARITAFDVGANRGQSIAKISEVFPQASIHAFEPSPINVRAISPRPGLTINCCGLGSTSSELALTESDDMSSFLAKGRDGWGSSTAKTLVPVTTIDNYCAEREIFHINLLKIDTQGFDFEVLKGAAKMLASRSVDLIMTEITLSELYKGLPRLDAVYGFMADAGYALLGVYDQHTIGNVLGWADFGFINPALTNSSATSIGDADLAAHLHNRPTSGLLKRKRDLRFDELRLLHRPAPSRGSSLARNFSF